MKLSIVVVNYNLRRELPRTLFTLSSRFQKNVSAEEYEVIVVDNGSREPFSELELREFGPNFRPYFTVKQSHSPAHAINEAAHTARGDLVTVMIDGARMVSPHAVYYTLAAARLSSCPVVAVFSWHLGPDVQSKSVLRGYNQDEEDRLLESVDWKRDGYELFKIASLAGSARRGLFKNPGESNFLTVTRQAFEDLEGYDPRFDLPGGGLLNQDFLTRALKLPGARFYLILGEATFHQFHGGASTGKSGAEAQAEFALYQSQYKALRGAFFTRSEIRADYLGHIPPQLVPTLGDSARFYLEGKD